MPGNRRSYLERLKYAHNRAKTITKDLDDELEQRKELLRKFWAKEYKKDKREAEAPAASRPAAGEKN